MHTFTIAMRKMIFEFLITLQYRCPITIQNKQKCAKLNLTWIVRYKNENGKKLITFMKIMYRYIVLVFILFQYGKLVCTIIRFIQKLPSNWNLKIHIMFNQFKSFD